VLKIPAFAKRQNVSRNFNTKQSMEYEIIRNEFEELSISLPYTDYFDEIYNPDGYEEFPNIEIVFKNTEELENPSNEQINSLEYFLKHSKELSQFISEFIVSEREILLERGFQTEHIIEPKKNYRFSTIYIDDEFRDNFSFIGMTGICSWDEEHGFGVVLYKKEIIDFGDWNCGYTMYSSNKDKKFSLAEEYSLPSITEQKNKITELSQNIELDNLENYLSLLKWLVDLKAIYGYRKTKLNLSEKESVALIQSLETLDLSNKNLDSLHQNFDLLSNLNELNLSDNNLIDLPQTVYSLKKLTRLFLRNNKFSQIPESINTLENLTGLDLSENNIFAIPKSFENLIGLTYFSISNNKIEIFPEAIRSFKSLQILYAHNNNFKIIPKWIGELKGLTNLTLMYNHIQEIPSSIGNLTKLNSLGLDYNNIFKLPEEIGNLSEFCSISIINNQLTSLPKSILKIRTLYVRNNKIPKEKLNEYSKRKEQNPDFFNDDFAQELGRVNLHYSNPIVSSNNKKWWEFWK